MLKEPKRIIAEEPIAQEYSASDIFMANPPPLSQSAFCKVTLKTCNTLKTLKT